MKMGGAPGQELFPQQSFYSPRSEQQEGLGRQWALWVAACEAVGFGTEECKYTGASVQPGVPNHRAQERREMADLRSHFMLLPVSNHEYLSNPSGIQAPGVLVLQPGQFAKTQPKGLPEWMSVTIQLFATLFPGSCKTCLGRQASKQAPGSPSASLKVFWNCSMSGVTHGIL